MKYLGIDWGLKHLGFAISEGLLATPLKQVSVKSLKQALNQVMQITKNEQAELIVIGKPESGEALTAVNRAVGELKKLGYLVETTDETLSSHHSSDHQGAAALILQEYLDAKKE